MSPEIGQTFSSEELQGIGEMSIEIAQLGEDTIYNLVSIRNRIHLRIIFEMERNIGTPDLLEWVSQMGHEVDVIEEVIKKARLIMRLEGRDLTSKMLDERKRMGIPIPDEDGVWGSV